MYKKNKILLLFVTMITVCMNDAISARNETLKVCVASGVLITTASMVKGIYNIRYYDQLLRQAEVDYKITPEVSWSELPGQVCQNLVCYNSNPVDMGYHFIHGSCIADIEKKIGMFCSINQNALWSFENFKDVFPHTSFQSAYCISKNYLALFGYQDLGMLKLAVKFHINKIEMDFAGLSRLTDLPSYYAIPKNVASFNNFKNLLLQYNPHYGVYGFLGAFGYSPVHNGQRVKSILIHLAELYAFLQNFQELLSTCVDHDTTQLINDMGHLSFSIQHVNYIQQYKL